LYLGVRYLQKALTPGMMWKTLRVAGAKAQTNAIATLPLGQKLGGWWYAVFAAGAFPWLV
jgi:hypothetical protein